MDAKLVFSRVASHIARHVLVGGIAIIVFAVLWYFFTTLTAFLWTALLVGLSLSWPERRWVFLGMVGLFLEPFVGFWKGEEAVELLAKYIFLCFAAAVIQVACQAIYAYFAVTPDDSWVEEDR